MARKRHTAEQIIHKLREAEVALGQGKTVKTVCKQLEVTEQTYYRWRKEYGGLRMDQAKRLRELAYLMGTRGIRIELFDERTGERSDHEYPQGLLSFVADVNGNPQRCVITAGHVFESWHALSDGYEMGALIVV